VTVPLTYCAKTVAWPETARDWTHIGSTPFSTCRIVVSLVCQVTLVVTSIFLPPEAAWTVKQSVPLAVVLSGRLKLLFGTIMMFVTLARVTVAVVVALAVPDAAVIVDVPAETPVSKPPVLTVATAGVSLDQQTVVPVQLVPPVSVSAFPLLSVPAAVNCAVSPMLTLGSGGSIVILVTVGFTKKPLQATPRPATNNTAKEAAKRTLFFGDDIIDQNPYYSISPRIEPSR
jgi:hypothetical protein